MCRPMGQLCLGRSDPFQTITFAPPSFSLCWPQHTDARLPVHVVSFRHVQDAVSYVPWWLNFSSAQQVSYLI